MFAELETLSDNSGTGLVKGPLVIKLGSITPSENEPPFANEGDPTMPLGWKNSQELYSDIDDFWMIWTN